MWIGSIRLVVETKDAPDAGTDSLVQVTVLRNGHALKVFDLDYRAENDLERGALRNYDYIGPTRLRRRNDQTHRTTSWRPPESYALPELRI